MNGNRGKTVCFIGSFTVGSKDDMFTMNSQSKMLARKFIIFHFFQLIIAQDHNQFKYIDEISHT